MFVKATKKQLKLRLMLGGPSGSGKTFSALTLASGLGGKIAVIDTERGSASLYSHKFEFDVCELTPPYTPEKFIEAIEFADSNGYDVIILDSVTHEWNGPGGLLESHQDLIRNESHGNSYTHWGKSTPRHDKFVHAILGCDSHVIATARTKSEVVIEKNDKGKMAPVKIGTKLQQRREIEFEFTTVLLLSQNNCFEVDKDRTEVMIGKTGKITTGHAKDLLKYLNDGENEVEVARNNMLSCSSVDSLKDLWTSLPARLKSNVSLIKVAKEVKQNILSKCEKEEGQDSLDPVFPDNSKKERSELLGSIQDDFKENLRVSPKEEDKIKKESAKKEFNKDGKIKELKKLLTLGDMDVVKLKLSEFMDSKILTEKDQIVVDCNDRFKIFEEDICE